jgi:methyltransferase (TIGR00027 family)
MKDDEASATALLIARSQLMLADDPVLGWAVGPERARIYARTVAVAGRGYRRLDVGSRSALALTQAIGIPGIYLHYALRKLRIEQVVRDYLAHAPLKQVVVIAAGFDPLAALLHREHPDLQWIEVDHPATQRWKNAALAELGIGDNLALLPIDLGRQPLSSLFGGGAIEREATLVIAEGITMYLDNRQIDGLFSDVRAGTCPGSSALLFTYMTRRAGGRIGFESSTLIAQWWLALKRERFRWGMESKGLGDFLAARRYALAGHWDSDEQRRDYLMGRGLGERHVARGENIALARIAA